MVDRVFWKLFRHRGPGCHVSANERLLPKKRSCSSFSNYRQERMSVTFLMEQLFSRAWNVLEGKIDVFFFLNFVLHKFALVELKNVMYCVASIMR